jgi:phosphopantothenoylcysteine decarboxylase/phosphopantothenate--cysteine ligase
MKCIITAGPTYEPLDEVRRLTNFSTGRLGSELATFLSGEGHEVILLIGQQATWRGERKAKVVESFSTTADLKARLLKHASSEIGAVFHAAAVSDFGFGKLWHRTKTGTLEEVKGAKIPTSMGGLLAELVATPKIIEELRSCYPNAWLIGWKYEMDGGQTDVINKAIQQISANGTDACVTNGRAYGEGFGLVQAGREPRHYPTMQSLFEGLAALVQQPRSRP